MGSSHGQTTPRRTRVSSPHMSVEVNHFCRSTLVDEQQASRSFVTRVTVVEGKEQRRREEGERGRRMLRLGRRAGGWFTK